MKADDVHGMPWPWLGSYDGEDSYTDISRGLCAGEVGMTGSSR